MTIAIILAVALAILLVVRYMEQSKVSPGRLAPSGPRGGDGDGDAGGTGSGPGTPHP